jgi:hypothetical protein
MEPVTIEVKVRRGKSTIMQFALNPRASYTWNSWTPDQDILTPEGGLCELIVLPTLRHDGNLWRNGIPAFLEEESLATRPLDLQAIQELEEELPF